MSSTEVATKDLIEHAMRLGADETQLTALARTAPASHPAYALLGRIVAHTGADVLPNTPLAVWCEGGVVSEDWRITAPDTGSVWRELNDLRSFVGVDALGDEQDPLAELALLRAIFEAAAGS
jgi:hypothetical protein